MSIITTVGKKTNDLMMQIGHTICFFIQVIKGFPRRWHHAADILTQLFVLGLESMGIIVISGIFIGMVVALQGFNTLHQFGSEAQLGQLVALSVLRELGPVVSALLFAGRAGSSLAAELGLMQTTEQIDCISMMAIDPIKRIVFPRCFAGMISLPILNLFFCLFAILAAIWISTHQLGIDDGTFISNIRASVDFHRDILSGMIKTIVFGLIIALTAVFQGYHAQRSALGIARASTKTVVVSSLLVLFFDVALTAAMKGV